MERITYNIPKPPENYDGYLFLLELWDEELQLMMKYGGRRMERFKRGYSDVFSYFGTLEEPTKSYVLKLLAHSKQVILTVTKYDDKFNIGYGESKMLRDAIGVDETGKETKGAAASVDWINSTDGGGLHTQGYTTLQKIKALFDRVKTQVDSGKDKDKQYLLKGEFKVGMSSKAKIKEMLDPDNIIQCRDQVVDAFYVKRYIFDINLDNNPKLYPPLILFMPKDPNGLPKISSGHHMGTATVEGDKGYEKTHIEIPYDEWKFMEHSLTHLRTFGKLWNPEEETLNYTETFDSAAQHILDMCEEENLTKTVIDSETGKEEEVLNYKHDSCTDWLGYMNFKGPAITSVHNKAQTLLENKKLRMYGDLLMNWSREGLSINPDLKTKYDTRVAGYKDDEGFDWVFKISSANFGHTGITDFIWKNNYAKHGLILLYHPTLKDEDIWKNGKPRKDGLATRSKKWEKDLTEFYPGYTIELRELPTKQSTAKFQGWFD